MTIRARKLSGLAGCLYPTSPARGNIPPIAARPMFMFAHVGLRAIWPAGTTAFGVFSERVEA